MKFQPESGQKVIARGYLDVYAPRGEYQLVIDQVEPLGVGALELAFRKLHDRLAAEGLFRAEFKKELPPFPRHIAVVTSPSGAAIHDFLKILTRRWQSIRVTIIPTPVQGDLAAPQIAKAILATNKMRDRPEVLLVTRGGGSIEDLWAFNEEVVVRAIFESEIPVISAVGHEIDITLADLVADFRASTPSEAAEHIVPLEADVRAALFDFRVRMAKALQRRANIDRQRLDLLAVHPIFQRPHDRIEVLRNQLDEMNSRICRSQEFLFRDLNQKLTGLSKRLETISPLQVLARVQHYPG